MYLAVSLGNTESSVGIFSEKSPCEYCLSILIASFGAFADFFFYYDEKYNKYNY